MKYKDLKQFELYQENGWLHMVFMKFKLRRSSKNCITVSDGIHDLKETTWAYFNYTAPHATVYSKGFDFSLLRRVELGMLKRNRNFIFRRFSEVLNSNDIQIFKTI